ncbi:MAG: aminotransferase class IV [Gemmatimonadetes bacterium]|nr:aminotransferase class IV [Gemmatimonadota bacterium]
MLVYLNGRYIPKAEALIPVDDRGFLFGDGVYELTRGIRGKLVYEEGHGLMLERGMRELRIGGPEVLTREGLREISERLLTENGLAEGDATVYAQLTRGVAPRLHVFPENTPPTVYMSAAPFSSPLELRRGGVSAITLPDIRWARCDLKTVNLLPNVVAKQRAKEAGAFEAILLRDGAITEGSSTNVFGVIDGELRTYPKSNYILPGVTRDVLIGLARNLDFVVNEAPIFAEEIDRLEELFLSGTTTEVQPITKLDGQPIGDGRPGPVALALLEALYQHLGLEASVAAR